MARRGGLGHDRVRPVVIGHDGLGDLAASGARQEAGLQEDPEPLKRAALPRVPDVRLVLQRYQRAGRRGEVPGGAAGAG